MRHRRNCVFGSRHDFTCLSRDQKLRLMLRAESLNRETKKKRKHGGMLGRPAVEILRVLLYTFHNAKSGRTDPSYDKLQEVTRYCRGTIAKALKALEASRLVSIVRRMIRMRTEDGVRFQQLTNAYSFPSVCRESIPQGETYSSLIPIIPKIPILPELSVSLDRLHALIAKRRGSTKQDYIT